jgi:hypothetical protein
MSTEAVELAKALSGPGGVLICTILAALFFRSEAARWRNKSEEIAAKHERANEACNARHEKTILDYATKLELRDVQALLVLQKVSFAMDKVLERLDDTKKARGGAFG